MGAAAMALTGCSAGGRNAFDASAGGLAPVSGDQTVRIVAPAGLLQAIADRSTPEPLRERTTVVAIPARGQE